MFTFNVPTDYGVDATFWRILSIPNLNFREGKVTFTFCGWVSQDAYDKNLVPIVSYCVDIPFMQVIGAFQNGLNEDNLDALIKANADCFKTEG